MKISQERRTDAVSVGTRVYVRKGKLIYIARHHPLPEASQSALHRKNKTK